MFESIDNKYVIQPKQTTIVSGKKFLDTYAAKGFTKIVQDQSANIRIREAGALGKVEVRLLGEYAVPKARKEGKKKQVYYVHDSDGPEGADLGGRATRKIRKLIQKHFLTGYAWSLRAPNIVSLDFVLI